MKQGPNTLLWIGAAWVGNTMRIVGMAVASPPEQEFRAEFHLPGTSEVESRALTLEAEAVSVGQVSLFSPATGIETFEGGFPDAYWSVGDLHGGSGSDYWDDVSCNHASGAFGAWCAGTGSQADCTSYDNNMEAFMCVEAEYFGSSQTGTDRFYFSLWNDVEECCDYAWISVAAFKQEPRHGIGVCNPAVAGTLTFKSTPACSGNCQCHNGRCWTHLRVSLGPTFDDFSFLRMCFRFHSDEAVGGEGAYFDDIRFNGPADAFIYPLQGGFGGYSCTGTSQCTTNSDCPLGAFCKRGDSDCAGPGQCLSRPVSCSGIIARVCGCNGQTYDNACKANQAGVNVAYAGACASCTGGPFTIGGVVYSDCTDPITTGLQGVQVEVTCGASTFQAVTSGTQGLWQIPNVPCGTCTVCPTKPGHSFNHITPPCQPDDACYTIVVNQANQAANQSIQFLGTESCMRYDLNDDGFPSIVGDVPLAVDCLYRNDCHCPEQGCLCPADCNCDGFLSIIGDVPCLVDCYYRQLCMDSCEALAESVTAAAGLTVGGAVFAKASDPIASGVGNVPVELIAVSNPELRFYATSQEGLGLWRIDGVPEGTYSVLYRDEPGTVLQPTVITVSAENRAANQSLTFHVPTEPAPERRETKRRDLRGGRR